MAHAIPINSYPPFVAVKIAQESILVPSHAAKVSSPAPKHKEILKSAMSSHTLSMAVILHHTPSQNLNMRSWRIRGK